MPVRLKPKDIDPRYAEGTGGRALKLHKDGTVAELGFYRGGNSHGWVMHLPIDAEPFLSRGIELGHDPDVAVGEQVQDWLAKIEKAGAADGRVCSFCEKDQSEVATLIAGPDSYICNECIMTAAEILSQN
jgi:hypothetical protein